MLLRTAMLLLLIYSSVNSQSASRQVTQDKWLDTEGLYYLDKKQNQNTIWALVITRYGRSIPPKENDPEAPTKPGLYVSDQHYPFITYTVTRTQVSFQTNKIAGRSFRFRGTVHRVTTDDFKKLPELRGQLVELNDTTQKQKNVRFGRAVIY